LLAKSSTNSPALCAATPNVSSNAAAASFASEATLTACTPAAVAAAPTIAKPVAAAEPTLVMPFENLPKAVSDLRIRF